MAGAEAVLEAVGEVEAVAEEVGDVEKKPKNLF